MICPTCGSLVTIHSADEGTSCYQPAVSKERLEKLEEVAKAAEGLVNWMVLDFGYELGCTCVRCKFMAVWGALKALEKKG